VSESNPDTLLTSVMACNPVRRFLPCDTSYALGIRPVVRSGGEVLFSEAVCDAPGGSIPSRSQRQIRVKGKSDPLTVYSLSMEPTALPIRDGINDDLSEAVSMMKITPE
jgi:hypothetical protein